MVFIRVDAATNDISFKEVLLPRADDTTHYSYRDTIKLAARFINAGTATQSNVVVTASIHWGLKEGSYLTRSTVVTGPWPPGEVRDVVFQPFSELYPPYYSVDFCAELSGDEVPANNCSSSFERDSVRIYYEHEFQPVPLDNYAYSPPFNGFYSVGDTIPVRVAIRNNGVVGSTDVPLPVHISALDGPVVYARTQLFDSVPGETTVTAEYPVFVPKTSGRFCVRAWTNYSQEPVRDNDTLRWCFTVDSAVHRDARFFTTQEFNTAKRGYVNESTNFMVIFRNTGMDTLYNVPTRIRVYDSNANLIWTDTIHIQGPWPENSTYGIAFPFKATTPGRYAFQFCSELSGDEVPSNDCSSIEPFLYADFFWRFDIEAGAASMYPHGPQLDTTHYAGKPIQVKATFINNGNVYQKNDIPLHARINGPFGTVVFARDTTLRAMSGHSHEVVLFGNFTPPAPGRYCIITWSNVPNDPVPANDTTRWCFDVDWEFDIEAGNPTMHQHAPLADSYHPIRTSISVDATFLNNGIQVRKDVPLHVQIRDNNGVTFLRDTILASIGAHDSVMMHFGELIPQSSGIFQIVAWSDDPGDPQQRNDTARWSFIVTQPSSVDDEVGSGSSPMLSVYPIPAAAPVVVHYHLEHATTGSITLHDMLGRVVDEVHVGRLEPEGEMMMDVSTIPSGTYSLQLKTTSGDLLMRRIVVIR